MKRYEITITVIGGTEEDMEHLEDIVSTTARDAAQEELENVTYIKTTRREIT